MASASPSSTKAASHSPIERRAFGLGMVVAGLLLLTALSQAWLVVGRREDVLSKVSGASAKAKGATISPRRGAIYSADGQILATDEAESRLTLNPAAVPKAPAFFTELSSASGIPAAELEAAAGSDENTDWVVSLSREQVAAVESVKRRWDSSGIGLGDAFHRLYPFGAQSAGIVGLMKDGAPAEGIEGAANADLGGKNGEAGQTIETTIDSELQTAAFRAIRGAVETHKAEFGSAIVLDPRSGELLAVANWPTFEPDPEIKPSGPSTHMSGSHMARLEPGSMMKVLTLAKLIDTHGLPKPIQCRGEISIAGHTIKCDDHAGKRAHGLATPRRAIAESCNVSAANWGMALGVHDFYGFMQQLGLLHETGLKLPREVKGFAREDPPAPRLESADWGFGQSLTATPLELAEALSALANEGKRVPLSLVKKVGERKVPAPKAVQVFSKQAADTVLDYMGDVFDSKAGTGYELRIAEMGMAGKTGTAQVSNKSGQYVSNFIGFLPAKQPRFEILVMVFKPKTGGYYGAKVAGPAFREIAQSVIRRYNLAPIHN